MIKNFSYKTVATIVSDRLFDDLDRVNDLLAHMTGRDVTPRNANELKHLCRDYFMARYPALKEMTLEDCSPVYYDCYEADFNDILGAAVPVEAHAARL